MDAEAICLVIEDNRECGDALVGEGDINSRDIFFEFLDIMSFDQISYKIRQHVDYGLLRNLTECNELSEIRHSLFLEAD